MRTLLSGILLSFALTGHAATAQPDPEWEAAVRIPCPPLLTEHECRAHHEIMAKADDGERNAYLTTLAVLLKEREKSCSCSVASNSRKR